LIPNLLAVGAETHARLTDLGVTQSVAFARALPPKEKK
jgi:hypothetical protein